jgi:hypothetical protein
MKGAPRHRRAASRSGGATSAERDGRPVKRRTNSSATPWSVSVPEGRSREPWPCRDRRCLLSRSLPLSLSLSLSLPLNLPRPLPQMRC